MEEQINNPHPGMSLRLAKKYIGMRKMIDKRLDEVYALAKILTLFSYHPDADTYDEFQATAECGEIIANHIFKIFESMDENFVCVSDVELEGE